MGLKESLLNWPKPIRYVLVAMAIGIPTVGVGLAVWDWFLREDDQQRDATYAPTLVQVNDICPSMMRTSGGKAFARAVKGKEEIEASTNCIVPEIKLDECDGPPADGHMQIRACSDIIKVEFEGQTLFNTGCPEELGGVEYDDTVQFHPSMVGAGVAYWDFFGGQPKTPEHILLHVLGSANPTPDGKDGHSTRESSVMFPKAGFSFDDVHCD